MFNCPLDNLQTETKGTVLLKNADELKNFTKTEELQLYNAVKAIAESGAKVVVCGGKISDLGLDYANKMGLMTVRYRKFNDCFFTYFPLDLIQSGICAVLPRLLELLSFPDSRLHRPTRWDSATKFAYVPQYRMTTVK